MKQLYLKVIITRVIALTPKRYMQTHVKSQLPQQVQDAFLTALENSRLRTMPNSYLPTRRNRTHGLILLGDANNMRHPLTGGGMTVAFSDVVHIRKLLSPVNVASFEDTEGVMRQMSKFYKYV